MKTCKINLFKIYNFTTLSLSKAPSNSSSKLKSISIKSTKLERDFQLILASLSQFLLTKIDLSEFSNYKRHFLRLVRIPTNEKKNSISI
jgi:hypothetical protein